MQNNAEPQASMTVDYRRFRRRKYMHVHETWARCGANRATATDLLEHHRGEHAL